jgi:hypothetical protein
MKSEAGLSKMIPDFRSGGIKSGPDSASGSATLKRTKFI